MLACPGPHGVVAVDLAQARQLRSVIAAVLCGEAGGLVAITRMRAQLPLFLKVSPLEVAHGRIALIAIANPPETQDAAAMHALGEFYGLTAAEAVSAAGIMDGLYPKRIATMRRVSIATVRSQIAQVLGKPGCSDQRDLVRRFGWLAGSSPAAGNLIFLSSAPPGDRLPQSKAPPARSAPAAAH